MNAATAALEMLGSVMLCAAGAGVVLALIAGDFRGVILSAGLGFTGRMLFWVAGRTR